MTSPRPPLLLIVGPTGVGKSAIALELAGRWGGEILSADSIQVYRGMDIGSAKASAGERARIPHHCIDLCEPDRPFSVAQYRERALRALEEISSRGRLPIAVGGSGFYLKTFFAPTVDSLAIAPEIRHRVEKIFQDSGLPGLLRELDGLHRHPPRCLDRANARRVMRALERCLASGLELDALRDRFRALPHPCAGHAIRTLLLERPSTSLRPILAERIGAMVRAGLVDEVLSLRRRNFEANPSARCAVGYRQVLEFLDGKMARAALEEKIFAATWSLVRRQRTWFRHQLPIDRRMELADAWADSGAFAAQWVRENGPALRQLLEM
ncbi:MAG: tRNA (adenosine(37)-N6)-dimethylallyltransferase MiaA [Puniceicoccales bacterium]|jgi:tRNA dimethylallyltransferase|nr:tRNA (adenosine(37)-N6)-dimethylallyltransferase MiaA [Puniceicoccales bacterium]